MLSEEKLIYLFHPATSPGTYSTKIHWHNCGSDVMGETNLFIAFMAHSCNSGQLSTHIDPGGVVVAGLQWQHSLLPATTMFKIPE